MLTTQQSRQLEVLEQHECETWDALVSEQVLHALGKPDGLFKVSVRPLWKNRYRVNVYVGADAVSSRIAHSYFLEIGGEGDIIAATPKIARQY